MKEEQVKQLFRRFILNIGRQRESERVIELLQTRNGLKWYGDVMDETGLNDDIESEELAMHHILVSFAKVEEKIAAAESKTKIRKLARREYVWLAASIVGMLFIAGITAYFFHYKPSP